VLLKVPPGRVGVGGITPLDLGKSGERVAQMRQVEGSCGVVMGEATQALAFGCAFDHRKGEIRERSYIRSAPRRGHSETFCGGQHAQHHDEDLSEHRQPPQTRTAPGVFA